MFYKLLKIWASLTFRYYFRRIYISGTEHIPKNAPVLFIVNHPNSFMEACIVACFQHRDLHFLVRGDMFEKKWLKPILNWTNQIPIYRFKDGFSKLRNNRSTFDQSFEVLASGKALLIFPEASTQMVKYLRPLQKGAARLATGTIEEKNAGELYVIPTGVYYTEPTKSRSDVIVKYGKAIAIRKWLKEHPHEEDTLTRLTELFQSAMEEVVLSLEHHHHHKLFDQCYALSEPKILPFHSAGVFHSNHGFHKMRSYFHNFNALNEEALLSIGNLVKSVRNHHKNLCSLAARLTQRSTSHLVLLIKTVIFFFLGLAGMLVYGIPLVIAQSLSKSKIKYIEFYAPVRLALSMFLHLLTSVILYYVLMRNTGVIWSTGVLIALQISLYFFALFRDHARYSQFILIGKSGSLKQEFASRLQQLYAFLNL